MTALTFAELAAGINGHFHRFRGVMGFRDAKAWRSEQRLAIRYAPNEPARHLTKEAASRYLAWLDRGHVGRHTDAREVA